MMKGKNFYIIFLFLYYLYFLAHYNPLKDRIVDKFLNDPVVARAENVVILQVTATPYNLLTKNSRYIYKIIIANNI